MTLPGFAGPYGHQGRQPETRSFELALSSLASRLLSFASSFERRP